MRLLLCASAMFFILAISSVNAHDTWVQTNTNIVRIGDGVHIDLMLGNHGNDHRDYKLASKIQLDNCTFELVTPHGKRYDIRDRLIDTGYTPTEGFWSAKFVTAHPGLHAVVHTLDGVHHKTRGIKSGKTFFVASQTLDEVPTDNPGFDRIYGHPLELVPEANPVTPMGPGEAIKVRVLYKGKPLANARVSFIPRGHELAEGFDEEFERRTDEEGRASFTPRTGNYYLIAAHHAAPEEEGEGYTSTKYSATLTVFVPDVCSCCKP